MTGFMMLLLAAATTLHFDVTDARGKSANVGIESGEADASGWVKLRLVKAKGEPVLIWPMESVAAPPDGTGEIPAMVISRGDAKALQNLRVVAALAAPVVLGFETLEACGQRTGFEPVALSKAFSGLGLAAGAFEKGIGLLYLNKAEEAAEQLSTALRERQRQLTRVPSEIYTAAMLDGKALLTAGKFDAASVAFGAALKQRPEDERARLARAEALIKAGKPEAAK